MTSIIPSENYPSAEEIAEHLKMRLYGPYFDESDPPIRVCLLGYETFRAICGRQRLTRPVYDNVAEAALKIGLIVAYGYFGVLIGTDAAEIERWEAV